MRKDDVTKGNIRSIEKAVNVLLKEQKAMYRAWLDDRMKTVHRPAIEKSANDSRQLKAG